jgi:Acylphosphatases
MAMKSTRVRITGLVQGVGYRNWCRRRAQDLGLSGFVRNRRDGSVQAVFCGAEHKVDTMVAACRGGPPGARVEAVAAEADDAYFSGVFEVRETA